MKLPVRLLAVGARHAVPYQLQHHQKNRHTSNTKITSDIFLKSPGQEVSRGPNKPPEMKKGDRIAVTLDRLRVSRLFESCYRLEDELQGQLDLP